MFCQAQNFPLSTKSLIAPKLSMLEKYNIRQMKADKICFKKHI